jgi:hypothetical protein
MTSKSAISFGIALFCVVLTGCERQVSFSADVKPILDNYCVSCHSGTGEGESASGFAVDDYDSLMQGTKFGQVVVTEKVDPKIHMPPHHDESLAEGRGFALSRTNIETIGTWIDQGARNN